MDCPLKIRDRAQEKQACCYWVDFHDGFTEAWKRWFDAPPTLKAWQAARRDWQASNTGWEAAHNAQRRAKERIARKAGISSKS